MNYKIETLFFSKFSIGDRICSLVIVVEALCYVCCGMDRSAVIYSKITSLRVDIFALGHLHRD